MLSTKKSSLSHKPKEPAEGLNERRPHGLRDGLRVPWISGEVGPKVEWQSPGGVGITWDNGSHPSLDFVKRSEDHGLIGRSFDGNPEAQRWHHVQILER